MISLSTRRAHPWVVTMAPTIYQRPSLAEVHAQHACIVGMLEERLSQAAELLAAGGPDTLAFTASPWRQSGRTTRRSASTGRSDTEPTWWASSPSRAGSECLSVRSSPSSTTNGRSPAAT